MSPTIHELEKRYRSLTDEEIEDLAYFHAHELIPDAQKVLKQEVARRKIAPNYEAAIKVQEAGLSDEEFDELISLVAKLPCPICSQNSQPLNASEIAIARSAVIVTEFQKKLIVGCPNCIINAANDAYKICLRYGWWAIPMGPIKTLQALAVNQNALALNDPDRYKKPTQEFIENIRKSAPKIKARIAKAKTFQELFI